MSSSEPATEPPLSASGGRDDLHTVVIDAIPDPILVVDGQVRVLDCNSAAHDMIGGAPTFPSGRRAGELLHCIHATETPGGCGAAPACRECTIRNSVYLALKGHQPRRARHKLEMVAHGITDVHLLVTTAPIKYRGSSLVLLILEDISELVALRRILPICAHCHRVRDDSAYWQDVESYCRRKLDIQFSHGICPECLKQHYPDWVS
jgi:PAS domain-containing protein